MKKRRIVFIVNPRAGLQNCLEEIKVLASILLVEGGLDIDIFVTERSGHAQELARLAAEREPCILVACGGDGTLNEVVNGSIGVGDAQVTHFPAGTGNDFIRMFGDTDRFHALIELLHGDVVSVDALECGGKYCLNVCSIGFDARVPAAMRNFRRMSFLGAKMPYNLAIVQCLMKGIHAPYDVEVDGEFLSGRYTLIAAMNGQYYGGGFNPTPEAQPDDGYMDVLLVRALSLHKFASAIGAYSKGRHRDLSDIIMYRRARSVNIVPEKPELVNLDGESAVLDKMSINVLHNAVDFLVPKGSKFNNVVEIFSNSQNKRAISAPTDF